MKHFNLLFLLLFGVIPPVFGQINQTNQAKGWLSGCVRDSADKTIRDASVFLLKHDSLVAITAADSKGCFSLNDIDTGKYVVHITHIGHAEYIGNVHIIPEGTSLPTIRMKNSATELDAVVIVGEERPTYKNVLNKNIYNVPSNVKKSSTDVYEILQHVPSLMVNTIERTVSLAGSKGFIVMVNNIRRDPNYMLFLKPSDIDKIEIIRNPGMRYKDDIDAIINIVTKAPPEKGDMLRVDGRFNPILLDNAYINSGYKHLADKLSVALYTTHEVFDENRNEYSTVRDVDNGEEIIHTEKYSDKGNAALHKNTGNLSAIIDYVISSKTFMTLNGHGNYLKDKTNTPYTGTIAYHNGEKHDFKSLNEIENKGNDYGFVAYLQTDFNKNSSMNFEVSYNSREQNSEVLFRESNTDELVSENRQIIDGKMQTVDFQANFMQQLKKVRLEEGYRGYCSNNNTNVKTNNIADNRTKYSDMKNYFYVTALGNISERLVYQAGIGYDMMSVNLNNTSYSNNEFIPAAMLRYNGNKYNVTLDYRLWRMSPSSSALNPTPVYNDKDTTQVFTGNPELKPYYQNSLNLSYEFSARKFYLRTSIFQSFSNNSIMQKKYLENGIYYTTYVNVADRTHTAFSLDCHYNIFEWWKFGVHGSLNYHTYSDSETQLNKKYLVPWFGLDHSINYKRLSAYVSYFPAIRKPTLTGYYTNNEYSVVALNFRLNNSWILSTMAYCFLPMKEIAETYSDGFSETNTFNNKHQHLRLTLRVQYRFQKGKQQYKQKRSKQYNDYENISTK